MLQNIMSHPSIMYGGDITAICKPLLKLKINYFSHVHIDSDNQFSAIANNPKYYEYYLKNECYNFDLHILDTDSFGKYVIWDAMEFTGKAEKENRMAKQFGIDHLFTIIEKDSNGAHYYHFGSSILGGSINQIYLSNINLLKAFIAHFKEKINLDRKIKASYNFKYSLNFDSGEFPVVGDFQNINREKTKADFLSDIRNHSLEYNRHKNLTAREMELLSWLHRGKTAKETALILGLAEVTVNKHMANIKEKTGCYNLFQLGEFFSHENY